MKVLNKILEKINSILNILIYAFLLFFLVFGIYSITDILEVYDETKLSDEILKYKPTTNKLTLKELQKVNPDILAWLTIKNSNIDYPIVQGKDNMEYLNLDYYKKYSLAGSIFLDYRNNKEIKDYYSVVYGHNMNGNAMFADINGFATKSYFDNHTNAYLYLNDRTYKLQIFSYMSVDGYDDIIYNMTRYKNGLNDELINYIKNNSLIYKDIDINLNDQLLVLSTCSRSDANKRSVIIAKLVLKK